MRSNGVLLHSICCDIRCQGPEKQSEALCDHSVGLGFLGRFTAQHL
uniref:Uncharacterized protein n=1 Tax=Anguilla anguilla TaxID=7936 RepID=A0A0E9R9R2_ANGAN